MKQISFVLIMIMFIACKDSNQKGFLSSATLESDLWKISPVVSGTFTDIPLREGDSVSLGQRIAGIDSVPLLLKLEELKASRIELAATIQSRQDEIGTLVATDAGIQRELQRATKLVDEGAMTVQRKDDLQTQSEVSKARIKASQSAVNALKSKFAMLQAQENSLRDQIRKCQILSPANGRVMTKYRNAGEAAIPGRPFLEIGRTDTLWADFFISQAELGRFKLGQKLRIRIDRGNNSDTNAIWIPAFVSWIASEAEFTPKGVQTREARNELVFRARILAANQDGSLKRGMPVEVWE
jgi:HlyD family secretion protein